MTSPREIVEVFRSNGADSELVGYAGLRAKEAIIVADQMVGARGAPFPVVFDSGGETYAIHATHPLHGRRVAALVTLGQRWLDASPPEVLDAEIAIDCGRVVQLGVTAADRLRTWADGERWLASRSGPPASHEVETPNGPVAVIVSDTGLGDGRYSLSAGFRPRKKQASLVILDFGLIGRDGWSTARAAISGSAT